MPCTTDVDGFVIGNCDAPKMYEDKQQDGVTITADEKNRRGDFAGYKTIDYNWVSARQPGQFTGMVAAFIDSQDVLPVQLCYSLQKKKPVRQMGGYVLSNFIRSDELMIWIKNDSAIICLVGQNIAKNSAHLIDDLNLVGVAGNATCQLRLARQGSRAISMCKENGVSEIILVGYSLGGSSVACISGEATRGIVLNGGAPPTNAARPVPDNCKVYHIVGDILSTHFSTATRIYFEESTTFREQTDEKLQIDGVQWIDIAYYHAIDRFMDYGMRWKIVTPQFEQNSLENYFFYKSGDWIDVAGSVAGILSVEFNFKRKIQMQICKNPIPGSSSSRACNNDDKTDRIIGGAIGGLLGGAASYVTTAGVGTVPGAIAGAAAGQELATGEKGILDFIKPEIGKKIVEYGSKAQQGIQKLDELNNFEGGFTGSIVDNNDVTQGPLVKRIKV